MFQIFHREHLLGTSRLEFGDPPMGCAYGKLIPSEDYEWFRGNVAPEDDQDTEMLRWTGLTAKLSDDTLIECLGVVLFDLGPPHSSDPEVDVIGISNPKYDVLFPGRYDSYERQMRGS